MALIELKENIEEDTVEQNKEVNILNTSNKSFGEYVASKTDLSEDEALYYTNVIFSAIMDAIYDGKTVAVHGFGSFKKVRQNPMVIFHQPTQTYIHVPEKFKLKFKPHNNLRKYINRKEEKDGG